MLWKELYFGPKNDDAFGLKNTTSGICLSFGMLFRISVSIIDTARIVCRAGSMQRSGVRLSVCLSHHSAAARHCGGFAAVARRDGDIDR